MNEAELLAYVLGRTERWCRASRMMHWGGGRPLSFEEATALAGFFPRLVLERVRIREVETIDNPDFYPELFEMGVTTLLDFEEASGITFGDAICVARAFPAPEVRWISLLFHEMVHVVQYELLGVRRFVETYIRDWLDNSMDYASIPLEKDAFRLQAAFEADPNKGFSASKEVAARLRARGLAL